MNTQAKRLREEARNKRNRAKAAQIIDQREEADLYRSMAQEHSKRAKKFEELAAKIDKEARKN